MYDGIIAYNGVKSCFLPIVALHNATHPGVMQPEMIPDLLHTVTTAGVRIKDRLVSSMCPGDLD
jgi:hypothetical protein